MDYRAKNWQMKYISMSLCDPKWTDGSLECLHFIAFHTTVERLLTPSVPSSPYPLLLHSVVILPVEHHKISLARNSSEIFTLLNISHLGQGWVKWVRDIKRYELQVIKLVSHTPWQLSLINHIAYWKVAKKVDLNSSHLKKNIL